MVRPLHLSPNQLELRRVPMAKRLESLRLHSTDVPVWRSAGRVGVRVVGDQRLPMRIPGALSTALPIDSRL